MIVRPDSKNQIGFGNFEPIDKFGSQHYFI